MRHAELEVARDELRAVVRDDARARVGELLVRMLQDDLDVGLGHRLANFPVDDGADADAVSKRFLERVAKNLGPTSAGSSLVTP
jgi:hypothetical protein